MPDAGKPAGAGRECCSERCQVTSTVNLIVLDEALDAWGLAVSVGRQSLCGRQSGSVPALAVGAVFIPAG